ncbi:uncharacterized protein [Typha angustifolia]|uniref:uncharacterized protein n=1 Tax=Typha angustifolia TaxID=59011 RepID=UPI003C2C4685
MGTMALIAQPTQVSRSSFSLRHNATTSGVIRRSFAAFQFVCTTKEFMPLKHRFLSREQPIILPKRKALKVLCFKGSAQNDEHGSKNSGSKFPKSQVQLSHSHQEREDVLSEPHDVQEHRLSYEDADRGDTRIGSIAIQRLFKKWLIMLRTQTSSDTMDKNINEEPVQTTTSESPHEEIRTKAGKMLKAALVYFVGLDAAISIPLLIFVPWYLSVKLRYGAEVTSELKPLWFLGPLIVALYIKVIQGLCALYLYIFMQAIQLARNLPSYSLLVYTYIAEGKLKAYIFSRFWEPIVRIKKMDYKALLRQKFKQLEDWVVEKYLDYVESIWPYYCRTIRFLKKAHLI